MKCKTNEFLKRAILRKRPQRDALEIIDVMHSDNNNNNNNDNDNNEEEYPIMLRANYNTMRYEIKCIQNKLWQAQQHWIATGILEAYTAIVKVA